MLYRIIIFFSFVLSWNSLFSQTLKGSVYDATTKKPISAVHVYLDGTSIYTITDTTGYFELNIEDANDMNMILSHVSYPTLVISRPGQKNLDSLFLKERVHILKEVVVTPDPFSYDEKLETFREQFLGATKAGKSCKILNEQHLEFYYNLKDKEFSATSEYPLIIENNYLGYRINYTLVDFKVKFTKTSMEHKDIQNVFIAGYSSFMDLKPTDAKTKRNRDAIYQRSSLFFFKKFTEKKLAGTSFEIYTNGQLVPDPYKYFSITDSATYKLIELIPETDLQTFIRESRTYVTGIISVLYRKANQTDITFHTNSFTVNQFGMIIENDKVIFSGFMGDQRIGDTLPLNYTLRKRF